MSRALLAGMATMLISASVFAADNTGTGDIGGVAADLTDSNIFTLNSTTLAIAKRAFLADGTALTSGATLPRGTVVKFMLYVNNNTAVAVNDISMQDVLDATFAYQAGTIKVDNTVANCAAATCTALEEAGIYTAVNGAAALTDATDADVATYTAGTTTIDMGNSVVGGNAQLNAPASSVYAVMFTVTMQ
jgi:uncharacterized repeat protein (TIGR01451 family)